MVVVVSAKHFAILAVHVFMVMTWHGKHASTPVMAALSHAQHAEEWPHSPPVTGHPSAAHSPWSPEGPRGHISHWHQRVRAGYITPLVPIGSKGPIISGWSFSLPSHFTVLYTLIHNCAHTNPRLERLCPFPFHCALHSDS